MFGSRADCKDDSYSLLLIDRGAWASASRGQTALGGHNSAQNFTSQAWPIG